ncbi:MAG TPA: hypothetical protein PKE57_00635 [Cellvibrionaceae bacterium]|nr:hypothetical protein [Cellvibrionaceae bacterium]HMW71971.1 hypothetical protein [Cellvibrionaceae bacterium]HMY40328.1 hypothetical protein [Marinagarivorans sp.]
MSKSLTKHISLLMFIIFVMSSARMGADRLVHDMQHVNHVDHEITLHHHHESDDHDDEDNTLVFNEHQMLHAIDLVQFFLVQVPVANSAPILLSFTPPQPSTQFLPLPSFDPPFRPPQSIFSA